MNIPKYDYALYHFGFQLGINSMYFIVKPAADINTRVFNKFQTPDLNLDSSMLLGVTSKPVVGFNVGIIGDLRLGKYFNLRFTPTLTFGERYINYSILGYNDSGQSIIDIRKDITSTFVDLPLFVKYRSKRLNNMAAYILGGAQYSIDLASNAKKKEENTDVQVKLKKNDVYIIVGVGFDFYNPWFKFGTELRMSYGLMDILKREDNLYTLGIDQLNSKIFSILFTFE